VPEGGGWKHRLGARSEFQRRTAVRWLRIIFWGGESER
jgi:hypothetical protein